MLVYISIAYCIVYYIAQFACGLSNKRTKRIDLYWLLIFFVALIFIGYHLEDMGKSSDLNRHYEVVNWYRDRMKNNGLPMAELKELYIYQLICWLVSLQENNAYLQVIYLVIDFFCILYITITFTNKVKVNRSIVAIYLLVYFTLTPFFYSYSGLRYSAICHIMGVGFYQYYYKNGKLYNLILIYVISFLIHPASGIYLIIQIWYECTKNRKFLFLLIGLWKVVAVLASSVLQLVPIQIVKLAGNKLYFYLKDYHVAVDVRLVFAQVVFLFFVAFLTIDVKKKNTNKTIKLFGIAALLGLGSGMPMFYMRMMMSLGPVLLPYIYCIYKKVVYRYILLLALYSWAILFNIYYTITIFSYLRLRL